MTRPSTKFSLLTLLVGGFVAGVLFWGGFNTAMEYTNRTEFCIGCHEMKNNAYAEYEGTIHHSNRTGVRAGCPDCHVPKAWIPKIIRKIEASAELYGSWTGKIDTPEKYEAHRHAMAVKVWKRMKETDSLECRNCHSQASFSPDHQSERNYKRHQKGFAEGKTCIDCHFGIAHKEPEGPGPEELFGKANPPS